MGYTEEGCFACSQKKKERYLCWQQRDELKQTVEDDRKELLHGAEALLDLSLSNTKTEIKTKTSVMDDLDLLRR